jgi:KaiC/GvpD/RAD55 family RecA-like ATPase
VFGIRTKASNVCKFGLPSLDSALEGGLEQGATYIIEQTIGADADPFVLSFLANGLQKMDYTYLLSTEQTFDYYKRIFQNFGRNPEIEIKNRRLRFIDGFSGSFQTGLSSAVMDADSESLGILKLADISDPREVNEGIRRSLLHVQKGVNTGIRGAILSFSNIIHTITHTHQAFSFLQTRRAMDKLENTTTLISLNSDAHDPIFVRAIEHMVDGTLRVTRVEDPSYENPLQQVEIVNIKTKAQLTGKQIKFEYHSGRLTDID